MVIKNIDARVVAKKFLVKGYNINPKAAKMLCTLTPESLDLAISKICQAVNGNFIITENDVAKVLSEIKKAKKTEKKDLLKPEKEIGLEKQECRINVLKDVTGRSFCEGKVEDFTVYFNSRFEKLSRILKARMKSIPIANLSKVRADKVEIVGMVNNVIEGSNSHIIELEDKTGIVRCIATGKAREIAQELLGDEVIGISGSLRGNNLIVDRIIFPDVPVNGKKLKKDFSIVFISDTHFGSKEFLEDEWKLFIKWLNGEIENERMRKIASKIRYIVFAGDIVDGVGIYPDQEKDLAIMDIYEQYEAAASHFDEIPSHIRIIVSPGNHDAVRQAEPQPALPKEIRDLFSRNVINVGNPSLLDLEGVKVLLYHGRSLDDLITKIPRLSYDEPQKGMEELLKRRHLAPMYGGRSPIAPEKEDYLVIDEIPDVLHSGHVHTYGTSFYRGVFLVNSSTWQAQTEFQKKVNLNPMPCNVAVYTPGGEVVRLKFHG